MVGTASITSWGSHSHPRCKNMSPFAYPQVCASSKRGRRVGRGAATAAAAAAAAADRSVVVCGRPTLQGGQSSRWWCSPCVDDVEQRPDVVALDGGSARGDNTCLGGAHWKHACDTPAHTDSYVKNLCMSGGGGGGPQGHRVAGNSLRSFEAFWIIWLTSFRAPNSSYEQPQ